MNPVPVILLVVAVLLVIVLVVGAWLVGRRRGAAAVPPGPRTVADLVRQRAAESASPSPVETPVPETPVTGSGEDLTPASSVRARRYPTLPAVVPLPPPDAEPVANARPLVRVATPAAPAIPSPRPTPGAVTGEVSRRSAVGATVGAGAERAGLGIPNLVTPLAAGDPASLAPWRRAGLMSGPAMVSDPDTRAALDSAAREAAAREVAAHDHESSRASTARSSSDPAATVDVPAARKESARKSAAGGPVAPAPRSYGAVPPSVPPSAPDSSGEGRAPGASRSAAAPGIPEVPLAPGVSLTSPSAPEVSPTSPEAAAVASPDAVPTDADSRRGRGVAAVLAGASSAPVRDVPVRDVPARDAPDPRPSEELTEPVPIPGRAVAVSGSDLWADPATDPIVITALPGSAADPGSAAATRPTLRLVADPLRPALRVVTDVPARPPVAMPPFARSESPVSPLPPLVADADPLAGDLLDSDPSGADLRDSDLRDSDLPDSDDPDLGTSAAAAARAAAPPRRASRPRRDPADVAAERAAADLALLKTFGPSDLNSRPDRAPVVSLEGPPTPPPPPSTGAAQPVGFRVVGRDGEPLSAVAVALLDDRGGETGAAKTDADGRGELQAPRPGSFMLVASIEDHQPGAVTLTVADAPVTAEVLLVRSSALIGTVSGEDGPADGARITLVQDGEIVAATDAGPDGTFRIGDLAAGEYAVAVGAAGCEQDTSVISVEDEDELRHDVDLQPAALPAE